MNPCSRKFLLSGAPLVCLLLLCSSPGFGAIWTNTTGGLWREAANWELGLPAASGETWITNANTKLVIIDSPTPVENLSVSKLWIWGHAPDTNTLLLDNLGTGNPLQIGSSMQVAKGGALICSNSAILLEGAGTLNTNATFRLVDSVFSVSAPLYALNIYGGTMILDNSSVLQTEAGAKSRVGRSTNGTIILNSGSLEIAGELTLGESLNRSVGMLEIHGGRATLGGMLSLSEGTGSQGIISMDGGQLVMTNGTNGILRVGNIGPGQVNLSGGVIEATTLMVGEDPTGSGVISLTGGQLLIGHGFSDPNFTNIVRIGDKGRGQLIVSNATVLFPNTSIARHTNSSGTLTVQKDSFIGFGDDVSIGRFPGATGVVNMAGGQLVVSNSPLWVGREGVGFLNMSNGLLQAESMFIAAVSTNTARGRLTLVGGSILLQSNFCLGDAALSTGEVTMLGGELTVQNDLGSAVMEVVSGTMTVSNGTIVADNLCLTNTPGNLQLQGGTLKVRNSIVSNGAMFQVGDGVQSATLYLLGGTNVFTDGLYISPNATVTGCGTIVGPIYNYGTLTNDCNVEGSPPVISLSPISQTVTQGTAVAFAGAATGDAPLYYQWRFNGIDIPGATDTAYAIESAASTNAGDYDLVVTNNYGAVTSAVATLTVRIPPWISQQPASLTVIQDQPAAFAVMAGGDAPLSYQWWFKGSPVGGDSPEYTIPSATLADAGDYAVVVENSFGSVTSSIAVLTVLIPPSISQQPLSQNVRAGSNVMFSVTAAGTEPLIYQWRFNTEDLPGETNSTLVLTNVEAGQIGAYSVVITNLAGSITSDSANLRVLVQPRITQNSLADNVANISFTTVAGFTYTLEYTDSITNADWTALSSQVTGSGQVETITDPGATGSMRIYRVRAE